MRKTSPIAKATFLGMICLRWIPASGQTIVTREQVLEEGQKVADAQLLAMGDKALIDWTWAVMAAGYAEFSHVAPKGDAYKRAMINIADRVKWTPLLDRKNPFNADDYCILQTFLDLYAADPDPAHFAPLKERMDAMVDHLMGTRTDPKLTFSWCDALFMAPPAMVRMSVITKDRKYIDAMDSEFWRTTEALYSTDEHLYYRDARYIHQKDANGMKIFWSRGNGWVLGGLARVLQYMPADYSSRGKYERLFKEMSAKLMTLQGSDGTWRTSLEDPAQFPGSETSGTALFTYAMAWGINNNLLDRNTYLPVVEKAWAALMAARRPDGLPGYTQAVGMAPAVTKASGTQVYATGAYLLAASQVQRLAPLTLPTTVTLIEPRMVAVADPTTTPAEPAAGAKAFARYIPERMDDIAWENDRIAHRIYGPALQHNPKEHSGSGIDVWVKSVREPVVNEWYKSNNYHVNRGTGLDFYEVGSSRGDGGLGVWDNGKLYNSKDWVDHKLLALGPDKCGFTLTYDPWEANGRRVSERRTMTLQAGSNLTRIESTIDSVKAGEIIIGIGLAKRDGKGGHLFKDKERGVMSYWQPPENSGTIGVGVVVDPNSIVQFTEDSLNYLVLVKQIAGRRFVYHAGACWDKGLDFKTSDQWEAYLRNFKGD